MARSPAYTCKHGTTFDPAKGSCPTCDSDDAEPDADQPGEGEILCAEAARRGLPDGLAVELALVEMMHFADGRKSLAAERADLAYDSADLESYARIESSAAKWADTAAKLSKAVQSKVDVRERIAAADRADRAQAKAEKH